MTNTQISKNELIEVFKGGSTFMLEQYTDKELQDQENLLQLAVQYAPLSVIKYLIEEKKVPLFHSTGDNIDFAINNVKNRSSRDEDYTEVYSLLLKNMNGKNPQWAINEKLTKSSLDSVVDNNSLTINQKKDIITSLLSSGADINKTHDAGYPSTVLGRCLLIKNDDFAKFLIDAGAKPDLSELSIGKTSLDFDSTFTTKKYVEQMKNPIQIDKKIAMTGLVKNIEENNTSEIKKHLKRPEFR